MAAMFNDLMQGFQSSDPLSYICFFLFSLSVFGAFMRLLYTLFKPW